MTVISVARLIKQDGNQDIEDEGEGKVRDDFKFLGQKQEWVTMLLQGKRRQLDNYRRESIAFWIY